MEKADLPIFHHQKQISQALKTHRVLIVSGKTGSGKSTQLPQFVLKQSPTFVIAVCEPRRLAASSLAARVSHELKTTLGTTVGYQIGMQSKLSSRTKICYMTYGILIQQLLFNTHIPYTHIILDEVHQRSLQMDFTFIALKKILSQPSKSHIKIIIMSATFNSLQFAKYFAIKSVGQSTIFFHKEITCNAIQIKKCQNKSKGMSNKLEQNEFEGYTPSKQITINDETRFKVDEYFIDQIEGIQNIPYYTANEDVKIQDSTYKIAVSIIKGHLSNNKNDILIFLPGMSEIKKMKQNIIKQIKIGKQSIIEVHSVYSQDLQKLLFQSDVKNKIIIATNIGESSITLPDCHTVVDFCLTRKNILIKNKGCSRFQTRVASKSSLIQRAGRIGRTSDGQVYRLISKQLYDSLDQFQVPEIKCVSLDLVILKAKQIDKTYGSNIFQNPYDVFLNALDPPKIQQIHDAVQFLLQERALIYIGQNIDENLQIWQPKNIRLTQIGEMMASMPCDIRTSKMILFSIVLGISAPMIDIAGIMVFQKPFFVHEERRQDIQGFMHNLVEYDEERYNDFLLKQQIFAHWREKYFLPFQRKTVSQKSAKFQDFQLLPDKQDRKNQQNLQSKSDIAKKTIEIIFTQFNEKSISKEQKNWCTDRGISPFTMRQILKCSESIRQKLISNGLKIGNRTSQAIYNELCLLCLSVSLDDNCYKLNFKEKKLRKQGEQIKNYVSMADCRKVTEDIDFKQYFEPLRINRDYQIKRLNNGFLYVIGPPETMSKLILPRFYKNSSDRLSSKLFRHLTNGKMMCICYTFDEPKIEDQDGKAITILNDSINKALIRPICSFEYSIMCDRIFQSKGKQYVSSSALIRDQIYILIKMITHKNVYLKPHISNQFYESVINMCRQKRQQHQLPFLMTKKMLKLIKSTRSALFNEDRVDYFRKINDTSKEIKQNIELMMKDLHKKQALQKWNKIFDQQCQEITIQNAKISEQIPISNAKKLYSKGQNGYFIRYNQWKQATLKNMYLQFKYNTIHSQWLICSKCWPSKITQISQFSAFDYQTDILTLKNDCPRWKMANQSLYCCQSHRLGQFVAKNEVRVVRQNLILYLPYKNFIPLGDIEQQKMKLRGKLEVSNHFNKQRDLIDIFECKICLTINKNKTVCRKIIKKQDKAQYFWKQVGEHLQSQEHKKNEEQFIKGIQTEFKAVL